MSDDLRTPEQALDAAISIAGTQTALARGIGCTPQMVSKIKACDQRVTAEIALKIEEFTKLGVLAHELRPDLFRDARPYSAEPRDVEPDVGVREAS